MTSPVEAIPAERIRAPRPRAVDRSDARTDEQHRPRERRAGLDDLAVPGQQRGEAAPGTSGSRGPACCRDRAGTRRGPCSAPARAARAARRRAGARRARSAPSRPRVCSGSGTCSSTSIAVASANSPSRERERLLRPQDPVLEVGRACAAPTRPGCAGSSRSKPTTRVCGRRRRPLVREDRLAAAHVEHRRGVDGLEQLAEVALERRHQAPDDRIASSRTCRRCCR